MTRMGQLCSRTAGGHADPCTCAEEARRRIGACSAAEQAEWLAAMSRAAVGPGMTDTERIALALQIARAYGQINGDHHKTWVIDQMMAALTGQPPSGRGIAP